MKKQDIIDFLEQIAKMPFIESNSVMFDRLDKLKKALHDLPINEITYFKLDDAYFLNALAYHLAKNNRIFEAVKLSLIVLPSLLSQSYDQEISEKNQIFTGKLLELLSVNLSNSLFLAPKAGNEILLLVSSTSFLKLTSSARQTKFPLFQCYVRLVNISSKLEKWDDQIGFIEQVLYESAIKDKHMWFSQEGDELSQIFETLIGAINQIKLKAAGKISPQRINDLNFWLVKYYIARANKEMARKVFSDYIDLIQSQNEKSDLDWNKTIIQTVKMAKLLRDQSWFQDFSLLLEQADTVLSALKTKNFVFTYHLAKLKKIMGKILYFEDIDNKKAALFIAEAIQLQTWVCENDQNDPLKKI